MKIFRISAVPFAALLAAAACEAHAQQGGAAAADYPNKPIHIVAGFTPVHPRVAHRDDDRPRFCSSRLL